MKIKRIDVLFFIKFKNATYCIFIEDEHWKTYHSDEIDGTL